MKDIFLLHKNNFAKYAKRSMWAGVSLILLTASACNTGNVLKTGQIHREGYVVDPGALETIPVGSSREQVLLALESPSITAMYDNEVFYYISQTRYRGAHFMKSRVIDRRILAIYFNKKGQVEKIANYGLQDGKLFDFASKTTPTGGKDQPFLMQMIKGSKPVQLPKNPR